MNATTTIGSAYAQIIRIESEVERLHRQADYAKGYKLQAIRKQIAQCETELEQLETQLLSTINTTGESK